MKKYRAYMSRRRFVGLTAAVATGWMIPCRLQAASSAQIYKTIPKTGEKLPAIGLGTSRTYDAINNTELLASLKQVTQTFFDLGGGMIDSSPMYGSAQQVLGSILQGIGRQKNLFAATKVWAKGRAEGIEQMENSLRLWGIERFDLMQIHNLIDWPTHLATLEQMKAEGKIRYIGITTSHGRFHDKLKSILLDHDFDFVQLTYNIDNRTVESPLLSIAQERKIAVIVNRPYQRGNLFHHVRGKSLPAWAEEFDCTSWGQFFLKFIISHPAVTCAIPATSKVKHLRDNMAAGKGRLPTAKERLKMIRYFESL